MRKCFINLIILLISLSGALVLGEIIIRWVSPQITYGGGASYIDADNFDLKPNFKGSFSHPDYRYEVCTTEHKNRTTTNRGVFPFELEILVLGDSFAFGMGVDQDNTLSSVISNKLWEQGISVNVVNAGVPGYTLKEIEQKYLRISYDHKFDIVIVSVCFNDWVANLDSIDNRRFVKKNNVWSLIYPFIRDKFLSNSQLAVFFVTRMNQILIRTGIRETFKSGVLAAFDPNVHEEQVIRKEEAKKSLKRIFSEIEGNGAIAMFVYIPSYLEVNDEMWVKVTRNESELWRDLPHNFLIKSAKDAGFSIILDPLSQDNQIKKSLADGHFPIDMHLNVDGNNYVGEVIAREIRRIFCKMQNFR